MKQFIAIALMILASTAFADDTKKTGKLSTPTGDDKTVVAVLHVEEPADPAAKEKKMMKKAAPPSTSINLIAKGDLAAKLADYITKNTLIEVSGSLADGKMTVTDVKEAPEHKKKKSK